MIVVTNTIKVRQGYGEMVAQRFLQSKGIESMPGFVRMEVQFREGQPEYDELRVSSTWLHKADFERWVGSDCFHHTHTERESWRKQQEEAEPGGPIVIGSRLSTHTILVAKHALRQVRQA